MTARTAPGTAAPRPDLAAFYGLAPPDVPAVLEPACHARPAPPPLRGRPLTQDEQRLIADWADSVDGVLPGLTSQTFQRKLAELVSMMMCDENLLATCMAHMAEGRSECQDRSMLSWQQVQTALLAHEASRGLHDAASLFKLGRGMYRLDRVDAYALSHPAPRFLFRNEQSEAMLRCRLVLRDTLQLPIPPVHTLGTAAVARGPFSDHALQRLRREILADESAQGGQALAAFLADWPPMTAYLSACAPELTRLHRSINRYGEALVDHIEAHKDGASSSSTAPALPINSSQYKALLEQAGGEVAALRHAANLAAVRGRYFSRAEGVQNELHQATVMRSPKAAAPFVGRLKAALAESTLDTRWSHPVHGWNHLHVAAAAGDAGLARALANAGVRPDRTDDAGMTPLHVAAANGHAEAATVFLFTGADVDAPAVDGTAATGFSPLHFAARSGSRACVEALVRGGADVDLQDPRYDMTALHFAAVEGRLDAVRALVAAGANPLLRTRDGSSALDALQACEAVRRDPGYPQGRTLLSWAEDMARIRFKGRRPLTGG